VCLNLSDSPFERSLAVLPGDIEVGEGAGEIGVAVGFEAGGEAAGGLSVLSRPDAPGA